MTRGWRKVPTVALLSASAVLLSACSQPSAATCPNDLPSACPSPAPSYATQVQPILAARCEGCHGPGGVEENTPLLSYEQVASRQTTILSEVYNCQMPPSNTPDGGLSQAQRQTLLGWLVCKAPNN